jgi:hypothetical protein
MQILIFFKTSYSLIVKPAVFIAKKVVKPVKVSLLLLCFNDYFLLSRFQLLLMAGHRLLKNILNTKNIFATY